MRLIRRDDPPTCLSAEGGSTRQLAEWSALRADDRWGDDFSALISTGRGMIPIRDTVSTRTTPWVVRWIVITNLAVFFFEILQASGREALLYRFGVVPAYWVLNQFSNIEGTNN